MPSDMSPERRAEIRRIRNCVPFVDVDAGTSVEQTQAAFDDLLAALDAAEARNQTAERRLALALMELGRVPDPRIPVERVSILDIPNRDSHFRASPVRQLTPAEIELALAAPAAPAAEKDNGENE